MKRIDAISQSRWLQPLPVLVFTGIWLMMLAVQQSPLCTGDFGNYYYGSLFLRNGTFGEQVYEPFLFNQMVRNEGASGFFLDYTPVPPFTAIAYLPFTFFSFFTAKLTWNLLSVLLYCLALYRLAKYYAISGLVLLTVTAVLAIPIKTNLYLGQTYLVLFFLLAEGFLAQQRRQYVVMAICWALAVHLKIFPAVVFLFLLKQKDVKGMIWLFGAIAVLFGISLVTAGGNLWLHYLQDILPRMANGDINDPYAINYQSMEVLLRRLFVYDGQLNPAVLNDSPAAYLTMSILFRCLVLFLLFTFEFTGKEAALKNFALVLLSGMLISGYGSLYGYLQLIFLLLCLPHFFPGKRFFIAAVLLCFLVSLPVSFLQTLSLPFSFLKLFTLLALFFVVGAKYIRSPQAALLYTFPFCILWIVSAMRTGKPSGDAFADTAPVSLLAYDYSVSGHQLEIGYLDQRGGQKQTLPLLYEVTSVRDTVFSHPAYNIRQATVVNDSLIYYLSDEHRGVGLYALRYRVLKN